MNLKNALQIQATNEDRDSGTESDDEQTFDDPEIASEMSSEISSGCSVRSRPTSQTSTDTLTCEELPPGGDTSGLPINSSDMINNPNSSLSDPPRRGPRHHYMLRTPNIPPSSHQLARGESPITADLYEDSLDPVEHHSSEEELEPLTGSWNRDNGPLSEKRKWSQVGRLSVTDSGSSDDEVCVLTNGPDPPVEFRTSPPLEVHKPLRSASPPSKMINLAHQPPTLLKEGGQQSLMGVEGAGAIQPLVQMNGTRSASPRKRHRHTPRQHRPCLDFEKMQQMKNRAVTQWRNGGELSLSFF